MVFERISRNRYFDPPSEYLHTSRNHWEDQNEFILPWLRMHNAHGHSAGITEGLEIGGAVGSVDVLVEAGAAITRSGRLISLATSGLAYIGSDPLTDTPVSSRVSPPARLPVGAFSSESLYVTIGFNEYLDVMTGSGGRMEQAPWLRLQRPSAFVPDDDTVVLGVVEVSGSGTIAGIRAELAGGHGRALAGMPAGAVSLRRPSESGNAVDDVEAGSVEATSEGIALRISGPSGDLDATSDGGGAFNRFRVKAARMVMQDAGSREVFALDANAGVLKAGTGGRAGHVRVRDGSDREVVVLDGETGTVTVGANGNAGDLVVRDSAGRSTFQVVGSAGNGIFGASGNGGYVTVRDSSGRDAITMDGASGDMNLGVDGNSGNLYVRDNAGRATVRAVGHSGTLEVGTSGVSGETYINDSGGRRTIALYGSGASAVIGTDGSAGELYLRDAENRNAFSLTSSDAYLQIGTNGNAGDVAVRDAEGRPIFNVSGSNGNASFGASGNGSEVVIRNNAGTSTIRLDGVNGRILVNGVELTGRPQVHVRHLWASTNVRTATDEVDLVSSRSFTALTMLCGNDPLAGYDRWDAQTIEVYTVDGVRTSRFLHGGDHFGVQGSSSNLHRLGLNGFGRRIRFRIRTFDNAEAWGLGIVFVF